jgi:hypothetical protein
MNDNADCIVLIVPMLDTDTGRALPPPIVKAIQAYVPKVEPFHKQKVIFHVSFKKAAAKTVEWFRMTGAKDLARSLNYEEGTATTAEYN